MRWPAFVVMVLVAGACGGGRPVARETPSSTTTTTTTTITSTTGPPTSVAVEPPPTSAPAPAIVDIAYRVERRVTDDATADFETVVHSTLIDPRGWRRASYRFATADDAPFLIVLAEGDEVDRLCRPYDTYGKYSCQNGPVVALNADRWRSATPQWTGDLATYRQMLVNHEVGHLLGMRHPPRPQCPTPGEPAAIMNQQSTELDGCLPNPWPLDHEIADAGRHVRKLAPAYGE